MSFMDKLMFWKKKDDFGGDLGLGKDTGLGADTGLGGLGHDTGLGMHDTAPGIHDAGLGKPNEFGLPPGPSPGMPPGPSPGMPSQPPPFGQQPMPQPPSYQAPAAPMAPMQPSQEIVGKDIEIVSSKLDALRATLESINQRLANLERVAYGEHEKKKSW